MKNLYKNKYFLTTLGFVIILSMILFYATVSNRPALVNGKINTYIEKNCSNISKCTIRLADFTDFEWDTFYFISAAAVFDNPQAQFPFDFPENYGFGNSVFVFVKSGKTVLFERQPYDGVEHTADGHIYVEASYLHPFTKERAIFNVERNESEGRIYYTFVPIQ